MGCLCIGADNKDAKVGAETRDARAPRQVSNRMSTRVDNQTEVKRVLAQTATEGEIYEDYQFGATLGKGGYALVKQALHKSTSMDVAVKILHLPEKGRRRISMDFRNSVRALKGRKSEAHYKAVAPQAEDLNFDDIFNEIIILESLMHPNVLHFFEYFISGHGDKIYIVTEFLRGGSLVNELTNYDEGFPEEDTRRIFRGLLNGVAYLHSKRVIHRDLKLENLIFATRGDLSSIRIVDFGLARASFQTLAPASERDGMVVGTPCYAAPETLDGKPYTTTVDCWALGLVLYQLMTGIHPFDNISNMKELFRTIRQGAYTLDIPEFQKISPEGKSLVRALLTVEYHKRITASAATQHRWFSGGERGAAGLSRLAEVANCMRLPELHFEPGEIILSQGERATYLLFLKSGQCEVLFNHTKEPAGAPVYKRIAEVEEGQVVGCRGVRLQNITNRDEDTMEEGRRLGVVPQPRGAGGYSMSLTQSMTREQPEGSMRQRRPNKAIRAWRLLLLCRRFARAWVGTRRNASVRATTPVTALIIDVSQIRWVLEKDPVCTRLHDIHLPDKHTFKDMAHLLAKIAAEHAKTRGLDASSIQLPPWVPFSDGVGSIIDQFERFFDPLRDGCGGQGRTNRKQREKEKEASMRSQGVTRSVNGT